MHHHVLCISDPTLHCLSLYDLSKILSLIEKNGEKVKVLMGDVKGFHFSFSKNGNFGNTPPLSDRGGL